MESYSTIVIGSGSGGLTVGIGLASMGRKVLLIERGAVGGDCTNVGCVPSKTLIHEANTPDQTDGAAILATVQGKRDHLRDEEEQMVRDQDNLEFVRGTARFVGSKTLSVTLEDGTRREFTAQNIVIATGSRPRELEIKGLPRERRLTNETLFELPQPPRHLAVVGSGPIALEMAFAFRRLGSRVSVVTLDQRVFANAPASASDVLHESLRERDIDVYFGATPRSYTEAFGRLTLDIDGREERLDDVDNVLIAVGRQRNIDQLGLEQAGVQFDPQRGITVDRFCQTNVPGIFAIGDVTPDSQWTHSAGAQGRLVVQRIGYPWLPVPLKSSVYPNATFSEPEVGNVGLMPDQIAKQYHPNLVKTLRIELAKTDKGYTDGVQRGFIELHVVRLTGRVLGATIVGPHAAEMISFFTLVVDQRISMYKLYRLVYAYPTLMDGVQKLADDYVRHTLPHVTTELRDVVRYGAATLWQRVRGRRVAAQSDQQAAHPLRQRTT